MKLSVPGRDGGRPVWFPGGECDALDLTRMPSTWPRRCRAAAAPFRTGARALSRTRPRRRGVQTGRIVGEQEAALIIVGGRCPAIILSRLGAEAKWCRLGDSNTRPSHYENYGPCFSKGVWSFNLLYYNV